MGRETIFAEIGAERERQSALGFGPEHDDKNRATTWLAILIRHLGLASDDGKPDDVCLMDDHCSGHDPARFRRQMVRVAAVAVAALETFDRKTASEPPRAPAVDWWAATARQMADEQGRAFLLVPGPDPKLYAEGRSAAYLIAEADANGWEVMNATARVAPGEGGLS